ncbi:MAG: sugar phosphate isomerase/epimerase family protein, partial [Candidatus Dormibacteraceae bacterium]
IKRIGIWRHKVAATGLQESARLLRDAGLTVSSLCRGGWFDAATKSGRRVRLDDNLRAIDEAAELGAPVLVIVCGPAAGRDIGMGRQRSLEAIETLMPYARERRVRLGLEPLHPMFAADRSVLNTLGQANDFAARADGNAGVVVDVYHIWWDHAVATEVQRAGKRIVGFHVSDWIVPTPDILLGRGVMGDGVIEIRKLRRMVDNAGYEGPIEVEILNRTVWDMPGDDLLEFIKTRFREHV